MILCYEGTYVRLCGYIDSGFAGHVDSRRTTPCSYVFTQDSGAVSWVSRLQKIVVLSITKAKSVAATESWKELI